MSTALRWADFLVRISPDLIELGRALFTRHEGDVVAARKDLSSVRADWLKLDQERLSVDAELAELERRRGGA
jgi:hypothetical protein